MIQKKTMRLTHLGIRELEIRPVLPQFPITCGLFELAICLGCIILKCALRTFDQTRLIKLLLCFAI